MITRFVLVAGLFTTASALGASAGRSALAARCAPAGPRSDFALTELRSFAASTKPSVAAVRSGYGIGSVTPETISLVVDETACSRAAAAVDTVENRVIADRQVHVYRLGIHYVVDWIRPSQSRARAAFVFDSTWAFKGSLGLTNAD
jgi:hypothetical protein